jgi:hypothetical protein
MRLLLPISGKLKFCVYSLVIMIMFFCIVFAGCVNTNTNNSSKGIPTELQRTTLSTTASSPYQGKYVNYFDDSRYGSLVYLIDQVNTSLSPGSINIILKNGMDNLVIEGNPEFQVIASDNKSLTIKSLKDGKVLVLNGYKIANDISNEYIPPTYVPIEAKELPTFTYTVPKEYVLARQ